MHERRPWRFWWFTSASGVQLLAKERSPGELVEVPHARILADDQSIADVVRLALEPLLTAIAPAAPPTSS